MINIGIIGFFLLLIKIVLHLYLMSKVKDNFVRRAIVPSSTERLQLFFHFYEDAPKNLKWLKTTINIMYAVAVLCIIIFLIWGNKH